MTPHAPEGLSFAWLPAAVILQRLFELSLSRRHTRALLARGGREVRPETYPVMVGLHVLFLAALVLESYPWRVPSDALTWGGLAALALATGLRYWAVASLGENWTTRVIVVPGEPVKRTGPYRFLRHPNYAVVVLEFLLLPLILRAPLTLAVFFPANLLVLRQRIRLEEKALRELTDYGETFPGT
jgi:methyltransferase